MKPEYIIPAIIAVGVVIGYNAFLVHRDAELFKAYDNQKVNTQLLYKPQTTIIK